MYRLLLLLNIFLCPAYSQLQECGGILKAAELELKSPGYPRIIKPDVSCEWIVQSVSDNICRLEVEFILADLHDASLVIAGEPHSGSLAGIRTFFFHNNTTISFRNGKSISKGFDIIIKQKVCEESLTPCGSIFISKEVIINGPPSTTKDCTFILKQFSQDECQVEVNFQNFFLESSPNCIMGGLEIGEDILCGNFDGFKKYSFVDKKLKIRFHTDNVSLRNHFSLKLSQVICDRNVDSFDKLEDFAKTQQNNQPFLNNNPSVTNYNFGSCCNRVHSERHFFLASPGFPNSNHIDCTFTVKKYSPEIQFLKLSFKYFWVGDRDNYYNNCNGGYLQISENFFCGCQTGLTWIEPFNFYSYSEFKTLQLFINQPSQNRFIGFVIEVIQCQFADPQPNSYKRQLRINFTDNIYTDKNQSELALVLKQFTRESEGKKENLSKTENSLYRKAKLQTHENIGTLPDLYCLSWNIKDWIVLLQQAVWAQLYCPINSYPYLAKILQPPVTNNNQFAVPSNCTEELSDHGWIQLPELISLNLQDEYCFRFRQIPDRCNLELIFHEVNMSWSQDCNKSYIFISGIGNLCFIPSNKRIQINFRKGPAELKIRSEEMKDTRILLEFQQLPCSPTTPS